MNKRITLIAVVILFGVVCYSRSTRAQNKLHIVRVSPGSADVLTDVWGNTPDVKGFSCVSEQTRVGPDVECYVLVQ